MPTRPQPATSRSSNGLRPVHPWALGLFRRLIAERRLRRQFRAVRLAFAERLPSPSPAKLIFYLNHPSWWDPLLCMVLAKRFIGSRKFYAPIDAAQLRRYAILRHLGLFPVDGATPRGAAQFLRSAEAVLARGDVLGLTPQGEFTDARVRPVALKPGLGLLLARLQQRGEEVTVVPIALEYPFWDQRLPEVLTAVGLPIAVHAGPTRSPQQWTEELALQLCVVQDELAELSTARNPQSFETLLEGGTGAAGYYGVWQRMLKGATDHLPKTGPRGNPKLPSERT